MAAMASTSASGLEQQLLVADRVALPGERVLDPVPEPGDRRAQLVGCARAEAPDLADSCVQPLHHVVQRPGQPVELVAAAGLGDALVEARRADAARRLVDARDRPQRAAHQPPAEERSREDHGRQRVQEQVAHVAGAALEGPAVHDQLDEVGTRREHRRVERVALAEVEGF